MNRPQELVDALALEIGRPVGVDDRRFRALAYSPHPDDIDEVRRKSILRREAPAAVHGWLRSLGIETARGPVRIPAHAEFGMEPRVCVPVSFENARLGYLWVLDPSETLGEEALDRARECAEELGEELFRLRRQESEERDHEAAAVRELAAGSDPAGMADRWRSLGRMTASYYTCLTLAVRDGPGGGAADIRLTAAVDAVRRGVAYHSLAAAVDDDRAIVMLAHDDPDDPARSARALRQSTFERFEGTDTVEVVVGVGSSRRTVHELHDSYHEAEQAARIALAIDGVDGVAEWEALGAYRTIGRLLGERAPLDALPPAFRRLLDGPDAETLVRTLESYLEHAGDAQATAAELYVHRSSLYNRLHRIEDLAGVDLRSGDDRLDLHLGVRLWRLAAGWARDDSAVASGHHHGRHP